MGNFIVFETGGKPGEDNVLWWKICDTKLKGSVCRQLTNPFAHFMSSGTMREAVMFYIECLLCYIDNTVTAPGFINKLLSKQTLTVFILKL